ncbi:hypothetical protein [Clavibacter michiganensis]|uniref:Uncharacterized protein n=1 Tax=Clavibacter michiganensis subsp. insidiosus TaxID=33014 RepID=A0A0D5CHQ9_9MICO|nr:hypothetical protein [Clavibacter michiganensis]AJW78802.1 hypothetical protein VO01_06355 [Clavibacter michiganensis subsp. insidiosus]AWF98536.1 hypothetical protein BEH61_08470 [Clavibacter michiganensis subsp. insidiosus]
MGAQGEGHGDGTRGSGTHVALRGTVARRPRSIRTVEGREVASVLVGPVGPGHPRGPEGDGILVVCTGAGAHGDVASLVIGEEVIVLGELVPRRAARSEHDAVELVGHAVLARRGIARVGPTAAEPRIAP